jgi:hypothetical protein
MIEIPGFHRVEDEARPLPVHPVRGDTSHGAARATSPDLPHHRRAEERDALAPLNLGLHPDVFAASAELEFFNNGVRFRDEGTDWYREQFSGWNGEAIVGEATPGYMFWRHGRRLSPSASRNRARRAAHRNPAQPDRPGQSAMVHHIEMAASRRLRAGRSREADASEPRQARHHRGGWYAASLEPYQEQFGDQLLVVLHDDVDDDPRGVYDAALVHIGAAPDFVPPEFERVRFSHQVRPSTEPGRRPLTLDERRELWDYFAADVEKLEQMIGRDLSLWNPNT